MFKQCPNCNTLNPSSHSFCKTCGAALPALEASTVRTSVMTERAPGFTMNRGLLALLVIVLAVAAILATAFVVSLLSNNSASPSLATSTSGASFVTSPTGATNPTLSASPNPAVAAAILPTVTPLPTIVAAPPEAPTSPPAQATTVPPPRVATTAPPPAPTATNKPLATAVAATPRELIKISPYDLGGAYQRGGDRSLYGRPEVALYGVGSDFNQGTINFRLDAAPAGKVNLKLIGLDDERRERCNFVVILNGVPIYDDVNNFPQTPNNDNGEGGEDRYWGSMTIAVPPDVLKVGNNSLILRNTTPWSGYLGIPYILINSVSFEG